MQQGLETVAALRQRSAPIEVLWCWYGKETQDLNTTHVAFHNTIPRKPVGQHMLPDQLHARRHTAAAWVAASTPSVPLPHGAPFPAALIHIRVIVSARQPLAMAQGLCAGRALCLLLLATAAGASQQVCTASETAAASPAPATAAAGWQRALAADPAASTPLAGPRIIDVSVALDAATPKFGSPYGLGKEFRVLEASQAKGDAYTSSLLRLGAHTGASSSLGFAAGLLGSSGGQC